MYYNNYNNSYNIFGFDGYDTSKAKLNLDDKFISYIPWHLRVVMQWAKHKWPSKGSDIFWAAYPPKRLKSSDVQKSGLQVFSTEGSEF